MTDTPHIAVCPGTYDPPTLGHLDVIWRASHQFDQIVVGVAQSPTHKHTLFSADERAELLADALETMPNVTVRTFDVLAVALAHEVGARTLVKGLRMVADFELETTMARLNVDLDPDLETVFLISSPRFAHVSSSGVRELAAFGADVSAYVTPLVAERLRAAFA